MDFLGRRVSRAAIIAAVMGLAGELPSQIYLSSH